MLKNHLHRQVMSVCALLCLLGSHVLSAQPSPGYYDSVDATNAATLRSTLHDVIDDHTRFPYTSSSSIDTWDILEIADENIDNAGGVITVYRNADYGKEGGGNSFYNREHSWPKSYGFPNDGTTNYPYTDAHHLFIADSGYNSSRSNKPFDFCTGSCSEKTTEANNGRGGAGQSNFTAGSFTQGQWEVWGSRRGDIARALMYMDIRYEGGTHGVTGISEPDLILTNDLSLIENSNQGSNLSTAYMGLLSVLIDWHKSDPVDDFERQHTEAVASFQGNRNPFVDNPQWVECLFENVCSGGGPDTTPPAAPSTLTAVGGTGVITLDWFNNVESDLAGYNVFRSTVSGGSYTQLNSSLLTNSAYTDSSVIANIPYFYVVSAVDTSGNESVFSAQASATASGNGGGQATPPWINEFHYDNASSDTGEFVEVIGAAGDSLSGWSLVAYNGNGGSSYKTVNLSGTFADQQGCMGTLDFSFSGLQNGAPDGIALVDAQGSVVDFISYEGTMTANDGPAVGLTAVDTGVSETSSTPVGHSLQRGGSGAARDDFNWQGAQTATRGQINTNQTVANCGGGGEPPVDTTPPNAPQGLVATALDAQVLLDWNASSESDLAGYDVYRATTPGGSLTKLTATALINNAYTDNALSNDATYYYVVTASDSSGNESQGSVEVSATPTAPVLSQLKLAKGVITNVSTSWQTVTLSHSYDSMVVVTTPNYDRFDAPAVVRVRNAAGNSFDIRIDAAGGSSPAPINVHYVAVEEGVYNSTEHGVTMEAVKYNSTVTDENNRWVGEARGYSNSYSQPVVVGQVMSGDDNRFSHFWNRGNSRGAVPSSSTLFTGKTVDEDPVTSRANEIIGYIIIEAGAGSIESIAYTAALGGDSIRGVGDAPPYNYTVSGLAGGTVAIASQAAMDGGNGGWAVLYGNTPLLGSTLALAIDEDQAGDSERRHTTEQVGYIIFE